MAVVKQVLLGVTVVSLIYELCKLIFTPQLKTANAKCPSCTTRNQDEGNEKSKRFQKDEEETSVESKYRSCSSRYQEEESRACNGTTPSTKIQKDEGETGVRSSDRSVDGVGTTIECTPGGNVRYTISSNYLDGLVDTSVRSGDHSENDDIGMAIECTPQGNVMFIIPTKYLDGLRPNTSTNSTTAATEDDGFFEISLDADQGSQDQLKRIFLEADLLHASRGLGTDNKTKELIVTILSDAAKYRALQQEASAREVLNLEALRSEASNSLILEGVSSSDASSSMKRLLAELSEGASYSDLSSSIY